MWEGESPQATSYEAIVAFNMDPSMEGKKIGRYTVCKRKEGDTIKGEDVVERALRHADIRTKSNICLCLQEDYFMTLEFDGGNHMNGGVEAKRVLDGLHFFKPSDFYSGDHIFFGEQQITMFSTPIFNIYKTKLSLSDEEIIQLENFMNAMQLRYQHEKENKEIRPRVGQMIDLYYNAMTVLSEEIRFLQYVIILEQAAMADREMTYRVSRNIALLLGESVDECVKIEKSIKNLYNQRSAIAHGGNKRITGEYAIQARDYACKSIRKLIEIGEIPDLSREYTVSGYGSFMKTYSKK